ncbi:hypothetical protein RFI_01569, partial [Reticulomyxa filosa]
CLLIVVKDIPPADTKQILSEFSKKIASFYSTNIYTGPYPPLTHDSFFKKFLVLRKSIESLSIIHEKKKKIKKFRLMINQRQWKERFEKILDNIPKDRLNLIHDNILKYLYSEFERQMPECKQSHSIHRQWFIAFQLFLKLIYLRRKLILEKWIANEFPEFDQGEVLAKFVKPFVNNALNQLNIVISYIYCNNRISEIEHNCLESHQCDQVCSRCQKGHKTLHDCREKNHTCGNDCPLKKYGNCNEKCGLECDYSNEIPCICNSLINCCNESCSLPGCPNKHETEYKRVVNETKILNPNY